MTDSTGQDTSTSEPADATTATATRDASPSSAARGGRQFHGWRLLGVIFLIILAIAIVSAIVDWWVIGPLEGRAPWL